MAAAAEPEAAAAEPAPAVRVRLFAQLDAGFVLAAEAAAAMPTSTIYEVWFCNDDLDNPQQHFFESRDQALEYLQVFLFSDDRVWVLENTALVFDESMLFQEDNGGFVVYSPPTHELRFGTIQLKRAVSARPGPSEPSVASVAEGAEGAEGAEVAEGAGGDLQSLPPLTRKTKPVYHVTIPESPNAMCYEDRTEALESMRTHFDSAPIAWTAAWSPVRDNQGAVVVDKGYPFYQPLLSREDIDDFELLLPIREDILEFRTRQLEVRYSPAKAANKR